MDIGKIGGSAADILNNGVTRSVTQASDDDFAKRLEAAAQGKDDKELKKACQEFEAIMLDMLYKQMKATVTKSGLFKKEAGREIFETMYDEKLMEEASKTGSLGLADSMYKQLSRQYGKAVPSVERAKMQESGPDSEEIETEKQK